MAESMACSLAWVSASSALGSLSATIPPPAKRRAAGAVDLGAADGHRPRAVAGGVDPSHRAAVAAAVEALDRGDELDAPSSRGCPPRAGVG